MRSDADNAKPIATIRPNFTMLKEEVYASTRPSVFAAAFLKTTPITKSVLEHAEQIIEAA